MEKEYLKNNYIAPTIVVIIGILFLVFVINPYIDHQKTKTETDYHFDQAKHFVNEGQFEEAIDEYKEIIKISYIKFPYEYAMAQNDLGVAYGILAEVRDKETNAKNAISAFQKALEVYTVEKYPVSSALYPPNPAFQQHLSE